MTAISFEGKEDACLSNFNIKLCPKLRVIDQAHRTTTGIYTNKFEPLEAWNVLGVFAMQERLYSVVWV